MPDFPAPRFTIQTEACREYMKSNAVSAEVNRQMDEALRRLEQLQGQSWASRQSAAGQRASGAKFSMPGMMIPSSTSAERQIGRSPGQAHGNPRFAYDSYRR